MDDQRDYAEEAYNRALLNTCSYCERSKAECKCDEMDGFAVTL